MNSLLDRLGRDEIAFQTNRLALSTPVEAARAGQVGVKFALMVELQREQCAGGQINVPYSTRDLLNRADIYMMVAIRGSRW